MRIRLIDKQLKNLHIFENFSIVVVRNSARQDVFVYFFVSLEGDISLRMRIERRDNGMLAESNSSIQSEVDFVLNLMDLYAAAEVDRVYWLGKTDRLFFAVFYLKCKLYPKAKVCSEETKRLFDYVVSNVDVFKGYNKGVNDQKLYGSARNICEAGWLVRGRKPGTIELPVFFKDIKSGYSFEFKITRKLNASVEHDMG